MIRRQQTTATFAVQIKVPSGLTIQQVSNLIFAGITEKLEFNPTTVGDKVLIKLIKRETTYGAT